MSIIEIRKLLFIIVVVVVVVLTRTTAAFTTTTVTKTRTRTTVVNNTSRRFMMGRRQQQEDNNNKEDKFSFAQRIESTKCVVVGAIAGGLGVTPLAALHNILSSSGNVGQWEFDTDTGSIEAALFAIVYRYCIRTDSNDMLNQGVLGAFVLTRTLSKIQVPTYCSAIPLNCGPPTGYLDWNMIQQGTWSGLESVALFGAAALAMDHCFQKGWISKFS
jgi:hypothetical protein